MVACCSLTWKASTSPIVMTPTSPRSLTTGRWRMRFPVIMAAHASTRVSGAQAVALGEDADEPAAFGHHEPADAALAHELRGLQHGFPRLHGNDVAALP